MQFLYGTATIPSACSSCGYCQVSPGQFALGGNASMCRVVESKGVCNALHSRPAVDPCCDAAVRPPDTAPRPQLLALQDNKCGPAGCSACNQTATKLLVAGAASSTDPAVCITELCDDLADTGIIDPNRTVHKPVSLNLWRWAVLGGCVGGDWVRIGCAKESQGAQDWWLAIAKACTHLHSFSTSMSDACIECRGLPPFPPAAMRRTARRRHQCGPATACEAALLGELAFRLHFAHASMPCLALLPAPPPCFAQAARVPLCTPLSSSNAHLSYWCSPAGYYLAKHPLVPSASLCQRCEGCPAASCGQAGCTTCSTPGLQRRVALAGVKGGTGGQVYACRNSMQTEVRVCGTACMLSPGCCLASPAPDCFTLACTPPLCLLPVCL